MGLMSCSITFCTSSSLILVSVTDNSLGGSWGQTVIVVPRMSRCIAPSFGKRCHETKDAGIYACAHFVKDPAHQTASPSPRPGIGRAQRGRGQPVASDQKTSRATVSSSDSQSQTIISVSGLPLTDMTRIRRLNPHVVGRGILAHSSYQCALSGLRIA